MSYDESDFISGMSLCGFSDMFSDEIGAIPTKGSPSLIKKPGAKPKLLSSPAKKTPYGTIKNNPTVGNAKKVLAKSAKTAAAAVKSAFSAIKSSQAKPAPLAKTPLHPLTKSKTVTHVGAVAIDPAKAKTPKQKQAVAKHQAAMKKVAQAAQVAATAGKAARAKAITLAKKMKDQHTTASKIQIQKKGQTRVRGLSLLGLVEIGANTEIGEEVLNYLDEYYTVVGATPDQNNPGYLTDGSPDPAYADISDTGMDAALDPSLFDPSMMGDPFASVELPPPPPMDMHFADISNVPGAIPYDGSKGTPDGFIGSLRFFTKETDGDSGPGRSGYDGAAIDWTNHYGFIFGKPTGILEHGDSRMNSGSWNHVHGGMGRTNFWDPVDPLTAHSQSWSKTNLETGVAYGPIVGNPNRPEWKGLRADDKGNLFWFPQEAPDWATFPLKQAAAITAKAEQDAAAAAAKADAAAAAKAQADAAAAQAQQDAANALAESQAASDQKIAQAQMDTQSQQMDLAQTQMEQQQQQQASQMDYQQSQMDMQEQQAMLPILAQQAQMQQQQQMADMQAAQQAQQMLMDQARSEMEYYQQHPEVAIGPVPEQEVPGPIEDADQGDQAETDDNYSDDDGSTDGDEGEFYEEGME